MKRPLLGIAVACAVMACVLAALLASVVASDVVMCSGELRVVPEPAGWRGWAIQGDLGGYDVGGERGGCVGHGIQCAMNDAELRIEGVCPREGLSLRSWFDPNGIYASPSDIRVRASNGTFVASALKGTEEVYVGAFRPVTGVRRPGFKHGRGLFCALILALGLLGMFAAGIGARRRIANAAAFHDPARFKPAVRDASNAIVFEDDSLAPIAAASEGNPSRGASPGPVLVRVADVKEGSYRRAPSTNAFEVLEGDAATNTRTAVERAKSGMTTAFGSAFFLLVVAIAVQACAALEKLSFD